MPSQSPHTLREAWVALLGLSAVFLFEMIDNSILTVTLPSIGRDLHASTTELQWVTGAYSVVFGSLMLTFGALADTFGRRRIMLIGLVLLGLTSFATVFVASATQLIVVRAAMGLAAAMTTPGSMALAFRLFADDSLRIRAITLISTVGLVGMAIGPTLGGLVLSVLPWQGLLLVNVPIAVLAYIGIRQGIAADRPSELHDQPLDLWGALLGTMVIVLALVSPTLFVEMSARSWQPWLSVGCALFIAVMFVRHERRTSHPLLDIRLLSHPLVASGLAYKAAAGLATAGLGYLVMLQMQLAWGWSPAHASIGMIPQVVVLIAGGAFVNPLVQRLGHERAAWWSAAVVVGGLAIYGLLNQFGYPWVALALIGVSTGLRIIGVVAATNVLNGLPESRTTVGAALTDTVTEIAHGAGIAIAGTILASLFTGSLSAPEWSQGQIAEFSSAISIAGVALTITAAFLVLWGLRRSRALPANRSRALPANIDQ